MWNKPMGWTMRKAVGQLRRDLLNEGLLPLIVITTKMRGLSKLAWIFVLAQVKADPVLRIHKGQIITEISEDDCANAGLMEHLKNGRLCFMDRRLQVDRLTSSSASFADSLPVEFVTLFLANYGQYRGPIKDMDPLLNFEQLSTVVKSLSHHVVAALQPTMPGLSIIVPLMSEEQTLDLSDDVAEVVLAGEDYEKASQYRRLLNALHTDVIAKHMGLVTQVLTTTFSAIHLWKLKESHLQLLFADEDFCSAVTVPQLLTMGERREMAPTVPPSCIALALGGKTGQACNRRIRFFAKEAMSKMTEPIHPTCTNLLTKEQVAQYGSQIEGDARCQTLDLKNLPLYALPSVDPQCALNRFLAVEEDEDYPLGYRWRAFSMPLIHAMAENPDSVAGISRKDWGYTLLEHRQVFADAEDVCSSLPEEFFKQGGVTVGKQCFEQLDGRSQAAALLHTRLPDNALSGLADISRLLYTDVRRKEYAGFDVFKRAGHVENIHKLLEHLSTAVKDGDEHACSRLTVNELIHNLPLQSFISQNCIDHMSQRPNLEHLEHLSARVIKMLPFEQMTSRINAGDWATMTPQRFAGLVATGKLCATLDVDIVKSLPTTSFGKLDATCVRQLGHWAEMSVDQFAAIPPKALTSMTAEQARLLTKPLLNSITEAQAQMIGAEHAGTELDPLPYLNESSTSGDEAVKQVFASRSQGSKK